MDGAQLTDSISYNFIVQMIPHHRAAIEMSYNILQYTTCIPLQEIALGIIEEQTMSIQNMLSILDRCAGLGNAQQDVCCYHKKAISKLHRSCSRICRMPARRIILTPILYAK